MKGVAHSRAHDLAADPDTRVAAIDIDQSVGGPAVA
jgi:hypothetical protein